MSSALKNPLAAATALGAILLAGSALAAPTMHHHHRHHASSYAQMKAETIDQRIATLHADLMITPAEEADWRAVADTMRPMTRPCRSWWPTTRRRTPKAASPPWMI